MMQLGLVGLGAGAAAALLFASVTSGSWLSIVLFYLAPLPIMIAGLGWSHWAAMAAALTGAAALGLVFGAVFFFAFLAGAGIPAWWLVYLAMLARPVAERGPAATPDSTLLEWYPPGRLVVWSAVLATLVVLVAIPNFGLDAESFSRGLRSALSRMLPLDTGASDNAARLLDFMVVAIPPAAAVLATITNAVNLWLAGRVVKFSGRLTRPWPDLAGMTFPRQTAVALAIAVALSFLDGLLGIVAGVFAAALVMAYGLLGFAVMHAITRGMASRVFLLGGVYAAVMVFGWPVLALCVLGLIDLAIDLRGRVAGRRGPPAPT